MGVINFLLLSSLGLAITTQAQDCSRPTGGDNMRLKDKDILTETFQDGSKVTFACTVGYVTAGGSGVITCTAGSWSPVKLKCERRNCGSAGEVANGNVEYPEGTEFGDRLEVTCNTGYTPVGRSQAIVCGAQGWMGRLPECEAVICDPPPAVVDGTFNPIKETYMYAEVVRYSCQKDHTLNGSTALSCSDDGTFKPDPPKCPLVECKDPPILHGIFVEGSRPPHRYKATVTYKCEPGFAIQGPSTLTCGINNQWLPGLPTCERRTTTTTLPPVTPKKPPGDPTTTQTPANDGNSLAVGLGLGLTAVFVLLIICGCYFCGGAAFFKKKTRSTREIPDNVTAKDGEDVALS